MNEIAIMDPEAQGILFQYLEDDIRGREDVIYFATKLLGIQLNRYQEIWLRRTTTPRQSWREIFPDSESFPDSFFEGMMFGKNISSVGNQSGKSVAIAVKHLWFCRYKIGMDLPPEMINTTDYATLNISPHSRQTQAVFDYVYDILHERWIIIQPDGTKSTNRLHPLMQNFYESSNNNKGEHRFSNGSTFHSVSTGQDQAASLAGGQFGYISYDEASQSRHLEAELGAKILSRLLKYGVCLDLIATPEVDSKSQQYYYRLVKKGMQGKDNWWAMTGMGVDDNIFIDERQKEAVKRDIMSTDAKKYLQVIKGEFLSSGSKFFNIEEIDHMFSLPSAVDCVNGRDYLVVADWGMSDDGDPSVFMVFDYTDYKVRGGKIRLVNADAITGGTPQQHFSLLRTFYDQYTWYGEDGIETHKPMFLMDANALGGVVIKKLLVSLHPIAFDTSLKDEALFETRRAMCMNRKLTKDAEGRDVDLDPDYGKIASYYIPELSEQLALYTIDDEKIEQDRVMCLVMGVHYIVKKFKPKIDKKVVINPLAGYNNSVK